MRKLKFLLATMIIGSMQPSYGLAIDLIWDGGDGDWDTTNWNGGRDPLDELGVLNGSNGYGGFEGEEENIFISGNSTVTYDADALGSDFVMKQGSSLSIAGGAVWQQVSNDDWIENRWTELDLSNLVLDGGTFRRVGSVGDEGGGALIFASWKGDDNFGVSPLNHQEIIVSILNGGRLENEGQLWFGSWGDTPPNGTVITMNIDDGHVDLTGGDVVMDPEFLDPPANADLVFNNRFLDDFNQPEYTINFQGPGSLTVDSSGIVNAQLDENDNWINLDPVTFQDLWDVGILQADGLSGIDGASFDAFFQVEGQLGADDYRLIRSVLEGDYNNDGTLDAADLDLQAAAIVEGNNPAPFDLTGDGVVNYADRERWVNELRGTFVGDANLDGEFNSSDFVQVFGAGQFETGESVGWASGDWNGDQVFDSGDFVVAFQDGGFEQGPLVAPAARAVPEPGSAVLLGMLGLMMAAVWRRRATG